MSVTTRFASEADLGDLIAIEDNAFVADRISRRSFRTLLKRPTALVIVAQQAGSIVGYAMLLFRKASTKARLYSIATVQGERGRGRTLLDAVETEAAARGAQVIQLEVREDNRRAIELYERSGYRRFGLLPDYYADGASALRMFKRLTYETATRTKSVSAQGTAQP